MRRAMRPRFGRTKNLHHHTPYINALKYFLETSLTSFTASARNNVNADIRIYMINARMHYYLYKGGV